VRDAPTPKSIEILEGQIRDQLATQRSYVENLDAKAGVVLGFSGLVVAVAPANDTVWVDLARLAGVLSGVIALFVFLPRDYPVVDLRAFRRGYLTAEPTAGLLALVDTYLNVLDHAAGVIDHKSRWAKGSIAALLVAIMFVFAGLVW
jgi:hypothetical protein